MASVRLPHNQEQKLDEIARAKNVSRSQIIKEALELYISREEAAANPYMAGEALFGIHGSGESNRSATYKQRIKKQLKQKHNRS